ncbi:MAG TPA: hypothetical protein VHQ01_06050, partial [Pyrinomonadaceae bacterium]|nr:hypothetical protein [Pyrinomonadaceae bacterium]
MKKHKARLLSLPGCTGVAIGNKKVNGEATDQLAIVIFVAEKKRGGVAASDLVPLTLDGMPTDVVEKTFGFKKLAGVDPGASGERNGRRLEIVDPFARFPELFSGISITPKENYISWGTLGCIIHSTGNRYVRSGDYLLTNHHVLQAADPDSPHYKGSMDIIQPGFVHNIVPPANYLCGKYVWGIEDDRTNDCAIATISVTRDWKNEVPDPLGGPVRRPLTAVAQAAVGDKVYKFGATTQITVGVVEDIHLDVPPYI